MSNTSRRLGHEPRSIGSNVVNHANETIGKIADVLVTRMASSHTRHWRLAHRGGIPAFLMPERPYSPEKCRGMFHEQHHLDSRSRGHHSLHTWILWAPLGNRAGIKHVTGFPSHFALRPPGLVLLAVAGECASMMSGVPSGRAGIARYRSNQKRSGLYMPNCAPGSQL